METERPWLRCLTPLIPRRAVDGRWVIITRGQVWRRRGINGGWEYQQDEETADELLERW